MNKLSIPFCLLAAATLAACSGPQIQADSAESFANPVANTTMRPGVGRVVVLTDPTGPVNGITWQRMTLRMEDGAMQTVDRRGHQVAMGANVRVK